MNKAIIIDLDGTLLDSNRTITDFSREVLRRCRNEGILIIIATARPLRTVIRLVPDDIHDDYLALCNGAWVVRSGEVIMRDEMSALSVKQTVQALRRMDYPPAIESNDCFYTDSELDAGFVGPYFPLDDYPNVAACKVLAYYPSGINEILIEKAFADDVSYVITDNRTLVQISSPTCSKLNACINILETEGISLADTCAFGDDNNDISVFRAVGCGIAMGNSTGELKEVAKHVTESNDSNGVAKGILKHVLGI